MRAGVVKHLPVRLLLEVALAVLFIPLAGWAQQGGSAGEGQPSASEPEREATQTDANQPGESSSSQPAKTPIATLNVPPVREIGKARSLGRTRSPLQLGPVYVRSASFFYTVGDGLQLDTENNQVRKGTNNVGVFLTNIVYDTPLRRSRLVFQYQPRLAIVNGQVQRDLSTHAASLDATRLLSRSWSLAFNNTYSSTNSRVLYGDFFLDVDTVTGSTLQRSFLETPSRWISDYAQLTLDYQMSARDRLSIEPRFIYYHTSLSSLPTSSYTYGGTLSWDRTLSRTRGFGLFYMLERRQFSRLLPTTFYQAIGAGYAQQLTPTWRINISLGAGTAADRSGRQWTVTGNASLFKNFRRSLLTLAYYRGNDFGGVLINRYADRADVAYGIHLTRRWHAGTAVGYHRANRVVEGTLAGLYATTQATYRVSPRVSWFMVYGHRWQEGGSRDLIPGRRNFFATGIRWEVHPQESY